MANKNDIKTRHSPYIQFLLLLLEQRIWNYIVSAVHQLSPDVATPVIAIYPLKGTRSPVWTTIITQTTVLLIEKAACSSLLTMCITPCYFLRCHMLRCVVHWKVAICYFTILCWHSRAPITVISGLLSAPEYKQHPQNLKRKKNSTYLYICRTIHVVSFFHF